MNISRKNALRDRGSANPGCAECVSRQESPEVYTVTRFRDNALLAFDIDLAHEICQDGRTPIPIPIEVLDCLLTVNGTTPEHVDHVDPGFPGIACPVDYTPEGEPVLGLIDGSHRAARCRRDGISFLAFQLTIEEAQRCQRTALARVCGLFEVLLRNSMSV